MKILILSCNTGEGHNSCAKALQIAMQRRGITCEIQDTLALVSEGLSQRVGDAYLFSTRGSLFEFVYKFGGFVSDNIDVGSRLFICVFSLRQTDENAPDKSQRIKKMPHCLRI